MNKRADEFRQLALRQQVYNQTTRGSWKYFSQHRNQILNLVFEESLDRQGKLAILGAGNCNDLDLKDLLGHFREVHLFDLDQTAMEFALRRQSVENYLNIYLHDEFDLSGLTSKNSDLSVSRSEDFDLVISTCVISQLLETVTRLPLLDRSLDTEMLRVRDSHLQLLRRLVRPDGTGILVTDMATITQDLGSLETTKYPTAKEIESVVTPYFGLNPKEIETALSTKPNGMGEIRNLRRWPSWIWRLDAGERHLVYAFSFTKSAISGKR